MAREPGAAMDFMGVGKSASASNDQGTVQNDRATLVRPTPTFLGFKDRMNWQSNLSVPDGFCQNPSGQPRGILTQEAAAFACQPALAFVKGKVWSSSEGREQVRTERIPLKRYISSEKMSPGTTLEELADSDLTQVTREESQRYPSKRFKQGTMNPQNETQALQQMHFGKDQLRGEHTHEDAASPQYSTHPTAGSGKVHVPQLAEDARVSACLDNHKRLTNSELTLSLSSVWSKEPKIVDPTSPLLSSECGARVGSTHLSKRLTAQLTIFYGGQVNVYDDVPVDKAKAIMLLAGSGSLRLSSLDPPLATGPVVPVNALMADQSQDLVPTALPSTSPLLIPIQQKVQRSHMELPQARKASLQRFLERRKERILAKVSVFEKKPEMDGSSAPDEALHEISSSSCKTLETDVDSSAPLPFSQLPANVHKHAHFSSSVPSTPSKALQYSLRGVDIAEEKESKQTEKPVSEKEILSLKSSEHLEEEQTDA